MAALPHSQHSRQRPPGRPADSALAISRCYNRTVPVGPWGGVRADASCHEPRALSPLWSDDLRLRDGGALLSGVRGARAEQTLGPRAKTAAAAAAAAPGRASARRPAPADALMRPVALRARACSRAAAAR